MEGLESHWPEEGQQPNKYAKLQLLSRSRAVDCADKHGHRSMESEKRYVHMSGTVRTEKRASDLPCFDVN